MLVFLFPSSETPSSECKVVMALVVTTAYEVVEEKPVERTEEVKPVESEVVSSLVVTKLDVSCCVVIIPLVNSLVVIPLVTAIGSKFQSKIDASYMQ